MRINDMFDEIKQRVTIFGLNKASIDTSFFSNYDDEFKESELFKSFMISIGNDYVFIDDRKLEDDIKTIVNHYFKFLQDKFESLSIDEQVNLTANEFLKEISFYRGSKMHNFHEKFKSNMLSSDLKILFNGNYYADVLVTIGQHFQEPVNLSDIKRSIKKEITKLIKKKEVSKLLYSDHYFKNMTGMDSIFKIKVLESKINDIKAKHNIQ